MNEMRVMAPEPEDSPYALARRVRGAIDGVYAFLDLHLIPAAPKIADVIDTTRDFDPHAVPAETDGPAMFQIYASRLARHIKRVEHILRCLLLILATKLITDPNTRARLSAQKPLLRAPAQRRPYDPDMMVQLTSPDPKSCFVSLPYASRGKSRSGRRSGYTPLDWKEVEISHLMARMAAFPKVLNSLDRRAETLAVRLLSGEIARSEEELKAPTIRTLGNFAPYERERHRPKHCPLFLRHLSHWLPPPDFYADCHPDDRETYNKLHSLAYGALSTCVI